MPQYIQLPDNTYYTLKEGQDYESGMRAAAAKYPEAFGLAPNAPTEQPKSGLMGAFGSGLESLLSTSRTGLGAAFGNANEAAKAGLERQEEIEKKYAPVTDIEKVKELYHKQGILPAAWEAAKQAPGALAQQIPNFAEIATGARLGAMAGTALEPGAGTGVGAILGGVLGATAPAYLQQFGGNVERQAQEQQQAGQDININKGRAAAYAVPQAALDVAAEAIPLGGSMVSKITGIPLAALAKGAPGVTRLADEALYKTLLTGTAKGALAEIPTEVAQQMLERAQAGLSLTSPDALKEYGETAYQVGLLAPLGAVGRLSKRSEARAKLAEQQQQQQQKTPPEQEQLLQLGYTPPTPPAATSELGTAPNVLDMMDEHKALRDQHGLLADQIAAAGAAKDHETSNELVQQHAAVSKQIDNLAKQIAMAGGIAPTTEQLKSEKTDTPEKILALAQNQVAALDKQIEYHQDALRKATDKDVQDFAAVPAISAKIKDLVTQKNQLLDDIHNRQRVVNTAATPKGETIDMFGRPEQPAALAPEQVSALQPEENKTGELFSQENMRKNQVRNSAYELSQAVKGTTDQDVANAFALGMSNPKQSSFRPEGLRAETTPTEKAADVIPDNSLHAKATEAARQLSEERLELPGRKRSLSATNEQFEAADEKMTALKNSIEKPQGNSAKSVVEQMQELGQAHDAIQNKLNAGKASLTTAEKAQLLNSQLGKGKPPAPRPMTDMEKNKLKKEQAKILASYNNLLTKVTETRDQIENLRRSLYTTKEVEAQGVTEERQRKSLIKEPTEKQAEEGIKGRGVKSTEAKTAARINKGDVAKEAAASERMRGIAHTNGMQSDEYKKFMETRNKEIAKLKKTDPQAANNLRAQTTYDAYEKALQLGAKTQNYRDALNQAIERLQKALAESGTTQQVASKRTTQEMRTQSSAPSELRGLTEEAKSAGKTTTKKAGRGAQKAVNESTAAEKTTAEKRAKETATKNTEANKEFEKKYTPSPTKEIKPDTTARFRTSTQGGPAMDVESVNKWVDKIVERWKNVPNIITVDNEDLLPKALQEQISRNDKNGKVPGLYDPATNQVYLIARNLHGPEDIVLTIAHEVAGHYGLRKMLGGEYSQVMQSIYEGNNAVREEADAKMAENPELNKAIAVEEVLAEMAERGPQTPAERSALEKIIHAIKQWLNKTFGYRYVPDEDVQQLVANARRFVMEGGENAVGEATNEGAVFRTNKEATGIGSSIVGRPQTAKDSFNTIKENVLGLRGRVQYIDRHAALSEAFKKGLSAGEISSLEAQNAEWLLRFGEQRSQYAAQALTNGPLQVVKNKVKDGVETIFKSVKGANMLDVAKAFGASKLGDERQIESMATLYLAAKRAEQVGWEKLDFSNPAAVKEDYQRLTQLLAKNPDAKKAFEEGAKLYKQYNDGLIDWLVQTEAMTPKKAAELKSYNYVPFYRVGKDGDIKLFVDKERSIKIGNIKDEPQLRELVGGDEQIMPVFSSAIQNTMLLTNMGLRNKSVKETALTLNKLGIASRIAAGSGPANPSVVRFRINGEEHHAVVDNDVYGIPAELIVKGMEGIKTSIPVAVKMLGYPANILRQFVTRNPAYALRQVVRDPLNAWLTTGTDATPVLASMKELAKMVAGRSEAEKRLMESGAISSNVITGGKEDMVRMLREISTGKSGWEKLLAKADAFAMQGDAATRAVIYEDSLKKGMSEQQALLRTLESMNFSRRGLSPSMQVVSTIVPFFNAQIQGLDVLYRAFKGEMPFNEQLKIKQKLWARGMMLAIGTMAYASMMQDDDGYKSAKPEERLGNWFIPIPGQKDMLKVPIPFELGYLFKALPEAIMNASAGDQEASQAVLGMGRLLAQSNPFSLPQAIKPMTEVALGRSFFSGDIESQAEKKQLPGERARANTTELSKSIGHTLDVSPIVLDYLIRGYTGSLGIALTQLANPILASDTKAAVAAPTKNLSQMPFIGNLFQPVEGRGTLDEAYAMMTQIQQAKGTYNKMIEEGRRAEAHAFAQNYANQLSMATSSGQAEKYLGTIAKQERMIVASPTMTTEQKDARLEQLHKMKEDYAKRFLAFAERKAPQ